MTIKPMFGGLKKPNRFELPLRYYDPRKDERRKRHIRFERKPKKYKTRSLSRMVILFLLVLLLMWWLG